MFAYLIDGSRYDKTMQPMTGTGNPTIVTVQLDVNTMYYMDEVNMAMLVDVFLRQTWLDPRIQIPGFNDSLALGYGTLEKLWVPDLFFPDSQEAKRHTISTPNVLLRLQDDGRILYSQRLLLSLNCPMELQKFPLDSQTCSIKLETYGYTTTDLIFVWDPNPLAFVSREVPQYTLTNTSIGDCTTPYSTGNYSCLVAGLHVKRDVGYYITQTFLPSILITVLSWASFWIDKESTPARVSVGLLTVLAITTQSASIFSKRLKVSYIKAVDVWITTCLVFVFTAYMEYALVNVLARKYYKTSTKSEKIKSVKEALYNFYDLLNGLDEKQPCPVNGHISERAEFDHRIIEMAEAGNDKNATPNGTSSRRTDGERRGNMGSLVDKASRVIFPLAFLAFNIVFWVVYLVI